MSANCKFTGNRPKRRNSLRSITLIAVGATLGYGSLQSPPAFATISNTMPVTAATGSCASNSAAIQQAAAAIQAQAQNTYQQVPQPTNLSASTCFSSILNMGPNIGLSFLNPATLIQQMEQMACNAAQQALQWPVQQAYSAVGNNAQLPYGMGGVTAGQGGNSLTGSSPYTVNTYSSSGPALGTIPMGSSSTLTNALGG